MCIYQVITTTSMHCSYPHCTALSLLPFLLTGLSSRFHVPQTAHGSRTTHLATLNARTPTRELHARSLVRLPKKSSSFEAPSYPRSPQLGGQGKAKQSCPAGWLRCIAIGTASSAAQHARTKRTQARQPRNQSHARRKEGQAGQV